MSSIVAGGAAVPAFDPATAYEASGTGGTPQAPFAAEDNVRGALVVGLYIVGSGYVRVMNGAAVVRYLTPLSGAGYVALNMALPAKLAPGEHLQLHAAGACGAAVLFL